MRIHPKHFLCGGRPLPSATSAPSAPLRDACVAFASGTAMAETVLVLPFVLVVLALLFFFGMSFSRVERGAVMDRYEAWRHVARAPGPAAGGDDAVLNSLAYGGNAATLDITRTRDFPPDATELWHEAAANANADAGPLVQGMLDQLPTGVRVTQHVKHASTVPLYQKLMGTVHHQHTRLDGDWRFVNGITKKDGKWQPAPPHVHNVAVLRDQYLLDFEKALKPHLDAENRLAQILHTYYTASPDYAGPDVDAQFKND